MNALPLSLQFDFDNINTREKVADCVCLLRVCVILTCFIDIKERGNVNSNPTFIISSSRHGFTV